MKKKSELTEALIPFEANDIAAAEKLLKQTGLPVKNFGNWALLATQLNPVEDPRDGSFMVRAEPSLASLAREYIFTAAVLQLEDMSGIKLTGKNSEKVGGVVFGDDHIELSEKASKKIREALSAVSRDDYTAPVKWLKKKLA